MALTGARLFPLKLRLRAPLRASRHAFLEREGIELHLQDEGGRTGRGEATPLHGHGTERLDDTVAALEEASRRLRGLSVPHSLAEVKTIMALAGVPKQQPAARHAVELALLDLAAQASGLPLAKLLNSEARSAVEVNALLLEGEPSSLAQEAAEAVRRGFRTVKLKVAGRALSEDAARVAAVRSAVGDARIRIDANGGWSEAEAVRALATLGEAGLELCEQPIPWGDVPGLRRVRRRAPCRIAADESLLHDSLLSADGPVVDLFAMKPMVLGGLLPALDLGRRAHEVGIDSYVSSSIDGVVARAGAAHLAAALPRGDSASGLATGELLLDEPEHPFRPVHGSIRLPDACGLGLEAGVQ